MSFRQPWEYSWGGCRPSEELIPIPQHVPSTNYRAPLCPDQCALAGAGKLSQESFLPPQSMAHGQPEGTAISPPVLWVTHRMYPSAGQLGMGMMQPCSTWKHSECRCPNPTFPVSVGPCWGQSMATVAGWRGRGCRGPGGPRKWEWRAESPSEKGREAVGGGTTHDLRLQTPTARSIVPLDLTYKTQIQR